MRTNNWKGSAVRPTKMFCMVVIAVGLFLVPGVGKNTVFALEVNSAGPITEVRLLSGRPTFFADGKPFTIPLFATYVPKEYYYKENGGVLAANSLISRLTAALVILVSVLQHGKVPTNGISHRSMSGARNILAADKNAWMLPRIYIGTTQMVV